MTRARYLATRLLLTLATAAALAYIWLATSPYSAHLVPWPLPRAALYAGLPLLGAVAGLAVGSLGGGLVLAAAACAAAAAVTAGLTLAAYRVLYTGSGWLSLWLTLAARDTFALLITAGPLVATGSIGGSLLQAGRQ